MKSLYEQISANKNLNSVALMFGRKEISYPQLFDNIHRMAAYFMSLGIKSGDTVTVALPNIPSAVYTLYALNAIGAKMNNIHPLSPVAKIIDSAVETNSVLAVALATVYKDNKDVINKSKVRFAFVNPTDDNSFCMRVLFGIKYGKVKKGENIFCLDDYKKQTPVTEFKSHDTGDNMIFLHSGGTTAQPKVIALSDNAINNLALKIDGIIEITDQSQGMLAVLPTFHGFGLAMGVHAPLVWGKKVGLMMKFDVKKTIEWIDCGKINWIIGVPLLYRKLLKNPGFYKSNLSALDCAFVGGDNVPPSLIEEFNAVMSEHNSGCRMLEGYGLTETVTVCSVNTKSQFKLGSVGKPLRGIDITVLSDDGKTVPTGETGEVYVAGDTLMNGYYKDKAATDLTMVDIDGKKYIKTGDLGFLDQDGFIFLKGRKKRMFKISGINVYPAEVEKIATDRESVYDAALEFFDQPKPRLVLFVVLNKKVVADYNDVKAEIKKDCEQKLLKYCLPEEIVIIEDFPKTAVGKIDHNALKEDYLYNKNA